VLFMLTLLASLLLLGLASGAGAEETPTLTTDKPDYAPRRSRSFLRQLVLAEHGVRPSC
jgi:hypothetical protein